MTRDVIVSLAWLGVAGQIVAGALLLLSALWIAGVRAPLDRLRRAVWGYELWLAFLVALVATAGSLYLSEVGHFFPCELCWFQRVAMYPLAVTTLLAALFRDTRAARYLLPLSIAGAGVSVYHLFVENGVVNEARSCLISAPGGCSVKWMNEFGYMTIPTLALTGFVLVLAFFVLALVDTPRGMTRA